MPLLPGKKNIGRNITELEQHGSRPRSRKQILAIALHTADPKKIQSYKKKSMHRQIVEQLESAKGY